jgi:GT2 family glycosyltransferase
LIVSAERGSVRPSEYFIVDNGNQYVPPRDGPLARKIAIQRPNRNVGVAASWNRILRYAHGKDEPVVISNDDVVLGSNAFEALSSELERGEVFVSGLGFALFGLRPECLIKVGNFDERFFPAYYEDRDYERRMKLAGIEWRELSVPIHHEGWATSRAMNMEGHFDWHAQNLERYVEKWGGAPGDERFECPYDGKGVPADA